MGEGIQGAASVGDAVNAREHSARQVTVRATRYPALFAMGMPLSTAFVRDVGKNRMRRTSATERLPRHCGMSAVIGKIPALVPM